jgi:hypothetical protein
VAEVNEILNLFLLQGAPGQDHLANAYKYLANYHLRHGNLDDAFMAARKCTEFIEV